MSEQKQYMLLFSLGPVQSFISQARKVRDLMLGSFLLSMMMEAAMYSLEEKLVFPADPRIQNGISNLPNKYVALFGDRDVAIQAAIDSEDRIKNLWNTIHQDVWNTVIHRTQSSGDEKEAWEIWRQQSDPGNFFEIYWVVVQKTSQEYTEWFKSTQEALNARKRFRNFAQQNEKGEKSTVSGEREALRGIKDSREDVKNFWKNLISLRHLSSKDISHDGSERLDAIDTIKRFATYSRIVEGKLQNIAFPSTSSVATATFIESLLKEDAAMKAVDDWLHLIQKQKMDVMPPNIIPQLQQLAVKFSRSQAVLKCDGDLYFSETYTPKRLKEDYPVADASIAEEGRKKLSRLLADTDDLGIPRPTHYYAFIEMDGDHMGDILKKVASKEIHKAVSTALSNFSEYVPILIEQEYPGRLVYSGGDDVVVLAPLARNYKSDQPEQPTIKTILNLADQLQRQYCRTVKAEIPSEEITASIGIAIAHHMTSLSYVRRSAKQAEERAKKHYGRNCLVVTLLRRSGEQTQVGCRWHYDNLSEEGQPVPLFTEFYELFKEDMLSPKSVYTLLEEAPGLVELEKAVQQSEIKRVLLRQLSEKGKAKKERIPILAGYLASLAEEMDQDKRPVLKGAGKSIELHVEERRYGLIEVMGWLLVMVFLARKELE